MFLHVRLRESLSSGGFFPYFFPVEGYESHSLPAPDEPEPDDVVDFDDEKRVVSDFCVVV